jgi:hypothetical protein
MFAYSDSVFEPVFSEPALVSAKKYKKEVEIGFFRSFSSVFIPISGFGRLNLGRLRVSVVASGMEMPPAVRERGRAALRRSGHSAEAVGRRAGGGGASLWAVGVCCSGIFFSKERFDVLCFLRHEKTEVVHW